MDKNQEQDEEDIPDNTDVLIYIQKRLTKLENECATILLIIRDLQKQLRANALLSHSQSDGTLTRSDIHNVTILSQTVTPLTSITIPRSGIYIITVNICLDSYKCVKFQYLTIKGAINSSSYNEPEVLAKYIKSADRTVGINKTAELQKGDVIEVEFYHISGSEKTIIRSSIEAVQIEK